jgi:hypothetical protein
MKKHKREIFDLFRQNLGFNRMVHLCEHPFMDINKYIMDYLQNKYLVGASFVLFLDIRKVLIAFACITATETNITRSGSKTGTETRSGTGMVKNGTGIGPGGLGGEYIIESIFADDDVVKTKFMAAIFEKYPKLMYIINNHDIYTLSHLYMTKCIKIKSENNYSVYLFSDNYRMNIAFLNSLYPK